MRNKKQWLILKAIIILVFTVVILAVPTEDSFRKWLRFAMLTYFVVSFIIDLTRYKRDNG